MTFQAGGLIFHAAGIIRQGKTYLFFGPSGSGKTTVARLSANDLVLNDDLLLLMPQEQGWLVHATPFWNPTQVKPTAHQGPLTAMFRLKQAKKVYLTEMGPGQALAELVANVPVIPLNPGYSQELFTRCQHLAQAVPLRYLHFLPDASFWEVV